MFKKLLKNYGFIICMLIGIIGGCIVGAVWPAVKDAQGEILEPGARVLEPLGTVFINLMFCIVVPMVFLSITSAIANMASMRRAGKIMGVTVLTFCVLDCGENGTHNAAGNDANEHADDKSVIFQQFFYHGVSSFISPASDGGGQC